MITIPHLSWLRRLSLVLSGTTIVAGALLLLCRFLQVEPALDLFPDAAPIAPSTALAFIVLGLALLGRDLGFRAAGLLGLAGAAQGVIGGIQAWQNRGAFDSALTTEMSLREFESTSQIAPIVAVCLVVSGIALTLGARKHNRGGPLVLALAGSVSACVGLATLVGYVLASPAVYRWGGIQSVPPASAMLFLLFGVAMLAAGWREQQGDNPGVPSWVPLPIVIASATLTALIWLGLRDAENLRVGTTTQIALRDFASAIGREMERQSDALEQISDPRAAPASPSPQPWIDRLRTLRDQLPGAQAVYQLDETGRSVWLDPERGNEWMQGYDHRADLARRAALDTARQRGRASSSENLAHIGAGTGYAVYTPVLRENRLIGFIGVDVSYPRFFNTLARAARISGDYVARVWLGTQELYDSTSATTPREHRLEQIFPLGERRIRIELTPTLDNLHRSRRYLPELALAAGCGITLLLGLSVHLARTARTGLRTARLYNEKLVAENEERRRVEAMLKVSDERLRLALDSTQIGIFEWIVPSNKLYSNEGVWIMLGYPPNTIPPTPEAWTALIHPDDLTSYRAAVDRQLHGTSAFIDPEYRVRAATGEWRWLYSRSRTVAQSGTGGPVRILGTLQDITARKGAEEALRQSQATTRKLSLVASKTDNLVMIGSRSGTIEWVNESFERVMEYDLADVVGKVPASFMIGPETEARSIRKIKLALTRGEGVSTDVVTYSKSGKKFHMHLEIQPVRNEAGELENFIAIQADISTRVETERNLRRAKAEADAASRAKSEFLASMSHEIRTPMNGVIGMTSLLLDTTLSADQRDCVSTIRNSGEALLTIINDILDFSKIESGKMELENIPFELAVSIEDALELFSVQAAAKKLELVYHMEDGVPAWIQGDVTRLRQVLVNLVNNAVKFTPAGSIAVRVKRIWPATTIDDPKATLEFSVTDTGIGIPNDRINRLFQPFSQVDSSTTRKYGGTGLGLAICHRLCNLMGGEIGVTSQVGLGSTFTFTIKVEVVNTPPGWGLPELPARLNYGSILCVDDSPVSQARWDGFFRLWGAKPICVGRPETANQMLASDPAPIALVLDYEMTDSMAGRVLRESVTQCDIPTVLLLPVGQNLKQLEIFTGRRGIATATKPVRTAAMVRAIQSLFESPADSLPPFVVNTEARLLAQDLPLDVLLVEDNPVNQKVALRFLDRLGYRADAVANGMEAVSTLQNRQYHLVLMDLQMPEMDGFEAARQIRRKLPFERQPKIIALTANALNGDREQCLAAGMDDYITKPVKLLDIDQAIRRQFSIGSRPPLRALN